MTRSDYFHRLAEIFRRWEQKKITTAERNRMTTDLNLELTENLVQLKLDLLKEEKNG